MADLSVAEAAERLHVNVQRIHARIRAGSLPARRIGHQWVIDERDVDRLHPRHHSPGRPLSVRNAWALLAAAADDPDLLGHFSPSDRSRARARLRDLLAGPADRDPGAVLAHLAHLLSNRAERRCYSVSPRDLDDLRDDPRVRVAGVSAPESAMAAADICEGYVAASDHAAVVNDFLLVEADRNRANVILHVYDAAIAPPINPAWSNLLLAADLAEHDGPREHGQALAALDRLNRQAAEEPNRRGPR